MSVRYVRVRAYGLHPSSLQKRGVQHRCHPLLLESLSDAFGVIESQDGKAI